MNQTVERVAGVAAANALELRDLDVVYRVRGRDRQGLRDVTLSVRRGEAYGLVGESGSGKSTVALAIVQYLPRNGRVRGGEIRIDDRDVLSLSRHELLALRADAVSMVYQNPGTALNPSLRIGKQVAEVFTVRGTAKAEALERAREALVLVQIADPSSVMERYPHQLSGGMQQRVIIAMALAKDPSLLILDEPTTGLDATVEAEVLDLVAALQAELHASVLFISHNLGVIAKMCDRVGVLYAGRLVEEGAVDKVLLAPRHPCRVGLLRCIPRGGVRKDAGRLDTIPGFLPNLGDELRGCVFADRCALAQEICVAEEPPLYDVADTHVSRCHFHEQAQELPRASAAHLALPPVDRSSEPVLRFDDLGKVFRQHGNDIHALVGVSAAIWPGEALGLVGVCDEPTRALDVSVQAAILNLLVELQAERQVAYMFISHDLGVVRYISDRIAVLYLGRLMELGPAAVVFDGPHHPYTEALLSAVPTVDGGGRERIRLEGDIPSAAEPPSGCVFHTRCHRKVGEICELEEPPLVEVEGGHPMPCHIPVEELRRLQRVPAEAATA